MPLRHQFLPHCLCCFVSEMYFFMSIILHYRHYFTICINVSNRCVENNILLQSDWIKDKSIKKITKNNPFHVYIKNLREKNYLILLYKITNSFKCFYNVTYGIFNNHAGLQPRTYAPTLWRFLATFVPVHKSSSTGCVYVCMWMSVTCLTNTLSYQRCIKATSLDITWLNYKPSLIF